MLHKAFAIHITCIDQLVFIEVISRSASMIIINLIIVELIMSAVVTYWITAY